MAWLSALLTLSVSRVPWTLTLSLGLSVLCHCERTPWRVPNWVKVQSLPCDLRGHFAFLDLFFLSVVARLRVDMALGSAAWGVQVLAQPLPLWCWFIHLCRKWPGRCSVEEILTLGVWSWAGCFHFLICSGWREVSACLCSATSVTHSGNITGYPLSAWAGAGRTGQPGIKGLPVEPRGV